jgi:hypothetical protein
MFHSTREPCDMLAQYPELQSMLFRVAPRLDSQMVPIYLFYETLTKAIDILATVS